MLRELITTSRSYRRFYEDQPMSLDQLRELVDLARLSPSAGNLQALKYLICADAARNAQIYPHLRWAGYLREWDGPPPGERPTGYVVIVLDKSLSTSAGCDHGISGQSILLGAREMGLGGCMIANLDREKLKGLLGLGEGMDILMVIALGKPKEEVRLTDLPPGGSVKYYRDADAVHYVPKRALDDLMLEWPQ